MQLAVPAGSDLIDTSGRRQYSVEYKKLFGNSLV